MPTYLTPGVYVEEMPSGSRPIEGVATSVAAFIGFAEMGPRNRPTLVTNWSQFKQKFGDIQKQYYLAHAVYGYFNNGGGVCYVVNVASPLAPRAVVEAADEGSARPSIEGYAIRKGLESGNISLDIVYGGAAGEGAESAAPAEGTGGDGAPQPPAVGGSGGALSASTPTSFTPFTLHVKAGNQVVETYTNVVMDRESPNYIETLVNGPSQYVWLDIPASRSPRIPAPRAGSYTLARPALQLNTAEVSGDVRERSGIAGLEAAEDVTIVCAPDLMAAYQHGLIEEETLIALQKAMVDHCANMKNRIAILDTPPGLDPMDVKDWRENKLMVDSAFATLYYPWIRVMGPDGKLMSVPPSGHMAGIWARTDATRGVHKAPANEDVRGAVTVAQDITSGEQSLLNPIGINCIRSFGARGIRVWGARTLGMTDPSWKYINVRRLFNYIEASIQGGTSWAVFEPNDRTLWQKLKRDITSFLMRSYRDGALFGETPDQAFYVKCDAETNPPEQIDAGIVVVEIGICPVKPAEFVVFRVAQLPTGG